MTFNKNNNKFIASQKKNNTLHSFYTYICLFLCFNLNKKFNKKKKNLQLLLLLLLLLLDFKQQL